jgi:two-component system cell cycle sensor histidine kinase/response regulator CckA
MEATTLPETTRTQASPPAGPPLRILVVDDDDGFRSALRQVLESDGHKVTTASSGTKALELYGQHKNEIDVVLLDYYMPELDGAQTFEWMRRMKPSIKVIVISGADALELRQLHAKHAINGYLRKPLLIPELEYVIRKVAASPSAD